MFPDWVDVGQPDRLLPPGVHDVTVDEIEASLVKAFPASSTREATFANWLLFRDGVCRYVPIEHEYIDGSFVTDRLDPHDVDLSLWIKAEALDGLPPLHQIALSSHFGTAKLRLNCDAFLVPLCSPGHPSYPTYEFMQWTIGHWSSYRDPVKRVVPGVTKGYLRVTP